MFLYRNIGCVLLLLLLLLLWHILFVTSESYCTQPVQGKVRQQSVMIRVTLSV